MLIDCLGNNINNILHWACHKIGGNKSRKNLINIHLGGLVSLDQICTIRPMTYICCIVGNLYIVNYY